MKRLFLSLFIISSIAGCQSKSESDGIISENTETASVWAAWGDSMVGGSGTDQSMTEYLSKLLGVDVLNFGVGGITSEAVAMLQGGKPLKFSVEGNKIPESGKVLLHHAGIDPYNKQTSSFRNGKLNGVYGTLQRMYVNEPPYITLHYKFKREKKGAEIEVNDSVIFEFEDAVNNRDLPVIIWAGRNDSRTPENRLKTIENIQSMLDYLTPKNGKPKVLILSITNGEKKREGKGTHLYDEIISINEQLKQNFPEYYVDVRSFLVNDGLKVMGIEPDKEDLENIEADCIPQKLKSDALHLNDLGNEAVAKYLAEIIKERGY